MKISAFATNASIGVCSLLAGVLLGSNGASLNVISLAGLMTIPSVYGLHIIIDSRATNRVNKAERKASDSAAKLEKNKTLLAEIEQRNTKLNAELTTLQQTLKQTQEALAQGECERSKLAVMVANLTPAIAKLETELLAAKGRIQELEGEVTDWEENFHAAVDLEADKRFKEAKKQEIQRIFDEHDAITSSAMGLLERLQSWGHKVASSHEAKREMIKSLAQSYNLNIDSLNSSFDKERVAYLQQIEILREKVAQLQHELNGDLIEPQYGQFGYAIEGKIANDIARRIWEDLQIPLAVKGYEIKADGSTDVGYGYSRSIPVEALTNDLNRYSRDLARALGIHKITSVRKLPITDLIVVSFRREPAIKEDTVKHLVGTPKEFIEYIVNQPIRYRLIANPNVGKSPTLAVMVSEILKVGGRVANKVSGARVPNTLVSVSYPGIQSSLKDAIYPLEELVKYGDITASIKSIQDAENDWHYRERDLNYAKQIFQLWCWDEFDNTMDSASDPKSLAESLRKILKQAHHSSVGWIVSGQSVMTKQIPGFTNDDRSLFTEIVIGIPKIRKYLKSYGKDIAGDKKMQTILSNLDDIEEYVERENSRITDDARLLRIALIRDERSPKLYFLPNLDKVNIDYEKQNNVITLAAQLKSQFLAKTSGKSGEFLGSDSQKSCHVDIPQMGTYPPNLTIGGNAQSPQFTQKPHCPHCGGHILELVENDTRYQCGTCKTASNRPKKFVVSKAIWK